MLLTERQELVLSLIPYGKENAISRAYLCELTKYNDRVLRRIIGELREKVVICSSSQMKGYYRPTRRGDIKKFIEENEHRAKATFNMMKVAREQLKNSIDQEYFAEFKKG